MSEETLVQLYPYNTFHIHAFAHQFAKFSSVDELKSLIKKYPNTTPYILGGGSNILITENISEPIFKNEIKGIEIINENEQEIYVRAGAGEIWNDLVNFAVGRNFCGIENLALIPGSVGASPMQNIGAYGVEIKDVFYELEALHIRDQVIRNFSATDCKFGYRESVFKNELKNEFVILNVTVRLSKNQYFNISYGALKQEIEKTDQQLTSKLIAETVSNIRRSKLPDLRVIGNAGSFFKNPVVSGEAFKLLQEKYPGIPSFPFGNQIKIPAAWLIEQCGFKGYRLGDAGCHEKQPLVLVNFGNATGSDLLSLATEIEEKVYRCFSVRLSREVNIWP